MVFFKQTEMYQILNKLIYINKNCIAILILSFFFQNVQAQSISPVTQNIGGTLGQQTNYSLTFSVGEMISTTFFQSSDKNSISSGFLQSYTPLVTSIFEINNLTSGNVKINPNPVISSMYLNANFEKFGDVTYSILDLNAKVVYQSKSYRNILLLSDNINLTYLPAGTYYIRVLFQPIIGHKESAVYQFIKL